MIGPRIGVNVGPRVGVAVGVGSNEIAVDGGLQIIMFGDSQITGRGSANPTSVADQSNPGFHPLDTRSAAIVSWGGRGATTLADPPTYDIVRPTVAGTGVAPYGASNFIGMEVAICDAFAAEGVPVALTSYSIVGLACKQMVPAPSPAFPTAGPQWYATMLTFARTLAQGVPTIAVISAGNNDGLTAPDSAALAANMGLLAARLPIDIPTLIAIIWLKIHSDTVNFPGFIAGTIANQLGFFAANPTIKTMWYDDVDLQSDHAHATANSYQTMGQRVGWMALDAFGHVRPRPAVAPAIVGYGPQYCADGTVRPSMWGGAQVADLDVLCVLQQIGGPATSVIPTPTSFAAWAASTAYVLGDLRDNAGRMYAVITAGTSAGAGGPTTTAADITDGTVHWQYLGESWVQQSQAESATAGLSCRLAVFKRPVTAALLAANHGNSAPTIAPLGGSNVRNFGQGFTVRGPTAGVPPTLEAIQFSANNATGTTLTVTGVTTLGTFRLLATALCGFRATLAVDAVSLTGVPGITVIKNGVNETPAHAGGLFDIQSAIIPASGATGNLSATFGLSTQAIIGAAMAFAPS